MRLESSLYKSGSENAQVYLDTNITVFKSMFNSLYAKTRMYNMNSEELSNNRIDADVLLVKSHDSWEHSRPKRGRAWHNIWQSIFDPQKK